MGTQEGQLVEKAAVGSSLSASISGTGRKGAARAVFSVLFWCSTGVRAEIFIGWQRAGLEQQQPEPLPARYSALTNMVLLECYKKDRVCAN